MPGFLAEESFWEEEGGSALLQTNTRGFIKGHAPELVARVLGWAAMCVSRDLHLLLACGSHLLHVRRCGQGSARV